MQPDEFGTLAGGVARQLGLSEKPLDPNGYAWWLWVLVHWAEKRDSNGDTAIVLRPEVITALERLAFIQIRSPSDTTTPA